MLRFLFKELLGLFKEALAQRVLFLSAEVGKLLELGLLRRLQPDLVILEPRLPAGSGFHLLREAALEPAPAVIVLSDDAESAVEAFAERATDYVPKPAHPERLRAAIAPA